MIISDVHNYGNLIIRDTVDFDGLLGMDQLSNHHAVRDYFSITLTLDMTSILPVLLQGDVNHGLIGIISYMCARRIIFIDCEYYLTYIYNTSVENQLLDFVLVVLSFLMSSIKSYLTFPLPKKLSLLLISSLTHNLFYITLVYGYCRA